MGIGLVLVVSVCGYWIVIVILEMQIQEKKDMLCMCGVEFLEVLVKLFKDLNNYQYVVWWLVEEMVKIELNGVLFVD